MQQQKKRKKNVRAYFAANTQQQNSKTIWQGLSKKITNNQIFIYFFPSLFLYCFASIDLTLNARAIYVESFWQSFAAAAAAVASFAENGIAWQPKERKKNRERIFISWDLKKVFLPLACFAFVSPYAYIFFALCNSWSRDSKRDYLLVTKIMYYKSFKYFRLSRFELCCTMNVPETAEKKRNQKELKY